MEGMGLKLTPVVMRCLSGPLSMFGLWVALLRLIARPNSPNKGFNPPPAAHPSPPHIPPPSTPLTLTRATHDTTVVVNKAAQNPAVLAS